MLRIPRFAPPETLRVLAALRKSAKDVRRASSPACFCGFAQGADNYKIIPFSGRRLQPQPGSAFRGLPHPGRLRTPKEHNASWSPFGARPTRSASAPRRNTMLPGRPSGLPGVVYNRNRAPLFGARPTRSASAPREQGNSQLTLHFSVQHLSHFRYARSGSGKQAFSVYYHQQSLPIYTESPQTNG